ncbi:hemerythrin domain-containing protein [Roseateles chitinivorans]|uniref:hemerythrin domain-containing protein n=1 Tax=Roseateles chitinivorans TaxID=2917965 RepID=UPI003D66D64A
MPSTATTRSTAVRKSTVKASPRTPDAVTLLRADHKKVADLFEQFEKSRSTAKKRELVAQICQELTVHAQVEEEIFYPEVQAALRDKELVPEARVEHQSIKDLIAAVEGVEPDGEDYDAKVKVMSEWVKHHVKEEQNEMFPKAKKSKLDLVDLGQRIQSRKDELLAQYQTAH